MEIKPWKALRCEYCAAGMPISLDPKHHWTGNRNPPLCTAPTEDEYIAELEKTIRSAKANDSNPEIDAALEYAHDDSVTPPDIAPCPEEYDNYIDPYIPGDSGPSR